VVFGKTYYKKRVRELESELEGKETQNKGMMELLGVLLKKGLVDPGRVGKSELSCIGPIVGPTS
jgi:hypothetical protein